MAELADAPDLGSGGAIHGGSSPPFRTIYIINDLLAIQGSKWGKSWFFGLGKGPAGRSRTYHRKAFESLRESLREGRVRLARHDVQIP